MRTVLNIKLCRQNGFNNNIFKGILDLKVIRWMDITWRNHKSNLSLEQGSVGDCHQCHF